MFTSHTARHADHFAIACLRLAGYTPRIAHGMRPKPEPEMRRALHALDAVCLFLVGRFLVRPLLALREYIRPRAEAGEMMAFTAEPAAHETMLGLFTIPGLRWTLALVMAGRNGQATTILAARVVRLDHDQVQASARRGEQARLARARGTIYRLASLALACGGRA
jgi:hypothetical protein